MDICPFSKKPCDKNKCVHVKQVINGNVSEFWCCHDCANQIIVSPTDIMMPKLPGFVAMPLPVMQIMPQIMPLANALLHNFHKLQTMEREAEPIAEPRCEGCGASLTDVQSVGRFGCPKCYESFREQVDCILPQAHAGATKHVGKRPKCSIEALKNEMQKAVDEERYEDAAKFRDRIRELEKGVQGDNLKTPS